MCFDSSSQRTRVRGQGLRLQVEQCGGYNKESIETELSEFSKAMSDTPGKTDIVQMSIHLKAGTKVISQMFYRLLDLLKAPARQELVDLVASGIIELSTSHWASPLVPVTKSDGRVQLCVDFHRLNLITPQQHCYIPCLDDIMQRVGQAQVLSKLNPSKGFHQVV